MNSLPGLSMATVTFTQAAVTPEFKMRPSEFLEAVVELGEKAGLPKTLIMPWQAFLDTIHINQIST